MKIRQKTLLALSAITVLLVVFSFRYYTLPQRSTDNREIEVNADELFAGSAINDSGSLRKIAPISSISGQEGSGELFRSYDGQFYTTFVRATLQKPDQERYYEAWLVKEGPATDYYPLGRMFLNGNEYHATNISELPRPDYHRVIVTEEIDNGILNQGLGKVILSGSF